MLRDDVSFITKWHQYPGTNISTIKYAFYYIDFESYAKKLKFLIQ